MNEKQIAKILVKKLKELGFIIHRYNAFSTNSIYLKLDYGIACGIRIADHEGRKKYHYRFNVIKDYKGDKTVYFNRSYFLLLYIWRITTIITKSTRRKTRKWKERRTK